MPRTPIQTIHPDRDRRRNDERAVPQLLPSVANMIPMAPGIDIADNDPEAESLGTGLYTHNTPPQATRSPHTQADFARADAGAEEAYEEFTDNLNFVPDYSEVRGGKSILLTLVLTLTLGGMIGFVAARLPLPFSEGEPAPFLRSLAWGFLVLLVLIWPVLVGFAVQRTLQREFRHLARPASQRQERPAAHASSARVGSAPNPRHDSNWRSKGAARDLRRGG